jgi:hypothetical protein
MDKKYQVFVSSTYKDLIKERSEIIQALLELDCIPSGMELFLATDDDQWTLIKSVIDDCDYYIIVLGGRYGSTSSEGISYTEKEYKYAMSVGKPIIAFLHRDPGAIPSDKTEKTGKGRKALERFRDVVRQKLCRDWSTPEELGSVVSRSLIKLIKTKPAIGWVRADEVPSKEMAKEIVTVRRENEELKERIAQFSITGELPLDELAQGKDPIELTYSFELVVEGSSSKVTITEIFTTTWDDVFIYVAPIMVNPINDLTFKNTLNAFVATQVMEKIKKEHGQDCEPIGLRLETDDIETLKIQFRALRLITHTKIIGSSDVVTPGWVLTAHGDTQLLKMRVVRKNN